MGRSYKKKVGGRTYQNYTEETLNEALEQIVEGKLSLNKASKQYKIPYGTLHNRYNGKHGRTTGGQTALTAAEDRAIIQALTTCSDWGFPLSLLDLRIFVKCYLDKQGRNVDKFSNNTPGVDWAYSFFETQQGHFGSKVKGLYYKKES